MLDEYLEEYETIDDVEDVYGSAVEDTMHEALSEMGFYEADNGAWQCELSAPTKEGYAARLADLMADICDAVKEAIAEAFGASVPDEEVTGAVEERFSDGDWRVFGGPLAA